jgi:hypothetical protein
VDGTPLNPESIRSEEEAAAMPTIESNYVCHAHGLASLHTFPGSILHLPCQVDVSVLGPRPSGHGARATCNDAGGVGQTTSAPTLCT